MENIFYKSCKKLGKYIEKENFVGYDPYDTLNSFVNFKLFGKWGPALAIQFQKRNPVNIRKFIGIKKGVNPKGFGLLLKSYCINYKVTGCINDKRNADYLFSWLVDNPSLGYSGYSWGYNFDWATPGEYLKAYTPSVVVTSFVIDGIMAYYKLTKNQKAKDVILSACDYILKDIPITTFDRGISFSYTHQSKGVCYNASLLAAEILAKAYELTKKNEYLDKSMEALAFVLSKQKPDGRWNYSLNIKTGKEREQIDFHQGFILISIKNILKYTDTTDNKIDEAIRKGLDFYYKNQFYENGVSKWRIPKIYPVEIHNQAQGIITFSEFSSYNEKYLPFAKKIALWTIKNMQHKQGYFYYQKRKYYTNRISYMRWSQAWMFLALTLLLKKTEGIDTNDKK